MLCSYCGKIIEDTGVVQQGHTFCNNICRYSFKKASKTDDINKFKRVETKSQIHPTETVKKQNKTPGLQTYVDKSAKISDFELFANNKYVKLISIILTALIALLIYRGLSNYVENKQTFRILWFCICFIGFIAIFAANKHNKTPGQQTTVDNRRDKISNSKSFFDNNYIKLVFAILTALLIYRGITNYIEYKQTEAACKDLDKFIDQLNKNMNNFKKK